MIGSLCWRVEVWCNFKVAVFTGQGCFHEIILVKIILKTPMSAYPWKEVSWYTAH